MGKDTKNTILNQDKSQRDVFWTTVDEHMDGDPNIVIITADMSSPVFDSIRRKHPHRLINVGIAEQNAMSIASGLALSGKKVFVYGIASFIVFRCLEQIRINCSIMNLPITIVGVGAGFSYDDSGPTHHLFEDLAIIRCLPNIVINSVSDNNMAKIVADESVFNRISPNYVRLERHITGNLDVDYKFSDGWRIIRPSISKSCIMSTGYMNNIALEIGEKLDAIVVDIFSIPCNIKSLFENLTDIEYILTIEEHFLNGGFGSYMLEELNNHKLKNYTLTRFGMKDKWVYNYGGRLDNHKEHELDLDSIMRRIWNDK